MIANAAPWSMALKRRYLEVFPPDSLFEVYGSTELSVNTILLPADQLRKPGSCGKELPMVEIRLYDDDGNIVTGVGPEATGELYVRSSAVFDDYYKQPTSTPRTTATGSRPSATSPIATRRATSTSAIASAT